MSSRSPFTRPEGAGESSHFLLISPPSIYSTHGLTNFLTPPIGLAYLASSLQFAGYSVSFVDGYASYIEQRYAARWGGVDCWINGATIPQLLNQVSHDCQGVAITCMFMHSWPFVRDLSRSIHERFPDVPIVLGGEQVTATSEQVLKEIPFVSVGLGEGEDIIVDWAHCISSGRDFSACQGLVYSQGGDIKNGGRRERKRDPDLFPRPAWDLVPIQVYMEKKLFHGPTQRVAMPLLATRGCPYQCTFCTAPLVWGLRWYARKPVEVVNEMEDYLRLYNVTDFQFVDLTAILKRSWLVEFCSEIMSRGLADIRWQMPAGTRSEVIDAEIAEMLFASGCRNIVLAPESGSPSLLRRIKKKVNLPHMVRAIRHLRKAGVMVECNFIVGVPGETWGELLATFRFCIRLAFAGVETVSLAMFRPLPGSEAFAQLSKTSSLMFGDEICLSIFSSVSLVKNKSWNPNMGDYTVSVARLGGMLLFFTTSYLIRPWRLVRSILTIFGGRQYNRLDRVIEEFRQRIKLHWKGSQP